jgi:hypothetical protein
MKMTWKGLEHLGKPWYPGLERLGNILRVPWKVLGSAKGAEGVKGQLKWILPSAPSGRKGHWVDYRGCHPRLISRSPLGCPDSGRRLLSVAMIAEQSCGQFSMDEEIS